MTAELIHGQNPMKTIPCPCGLSKPFGLCCEPYLSGLGLAPTAEALMRSRYVGYCTRNAPYLLKTWHPKTRPPAIEFGENDDTQWIGLKILDTTRGGPSDFEGEVTFEARYLSQGWVSVLAERSRFKRADGAWLYLDGELSQSHQSVKVGRNDPCPCGSGKKFKKCCG